MYLLFQLRRLDVWPVGDPGVRQGYALIRGLPNVPEPKQLEELGEGFRPHRSIVARYCWADLAEQRTQLLPTPRERKDDTSNPTPPRHQPLLQDQRATGSGRRGRTVHRQRNRRRAPKTMEGPRRRGAARHHGKHCSRGKRAGNSSEPQTARLGLVSRHRRGRPGQQWRLRRLGFSSVVRANIVARPMSADRCSPAQQKAPCAGLFMGGTGLEPVTPSLSSWCSPN
jgi:hypothetical protein